ncbi:polysaccharide biosynthesis tyrosine autokinase [Gordonia sp. GONU]|uniref:polysaccharide biosynthesis tyrosine autokinase n=1 Tax=Gordonia sp. GONU TaxID=2972949 RepID=UPI0021ACD7DF|nr:polysaccharide biosynthesis tyrosine autokinase [Gordonia sp. GONU]MCR8899000.1 polysaccharide biosynthesis tyrosine autokinase [Gordonia sp. GONU]
MTVKTQETSSDDLLSARVRAFGSKLRDEWWVVTLVALLGALVGLGFSLIQTPIYSSSAVLYVTSVSESNAANAAYQGSLASQQRVASYAKLASSDSVVSDALAHSGVGLSLDEARASISAATTPQTVLLTISAARPDQAVASRLAGAVAESLVSTVSDLEEPAGGGAPLAKLTVVTPATPSPHPVSPKTDRNVAVGLIAGLVFGIVLVVLRARLDSKIRSREDVESLSDAPLLSVIPSDDELNGTRTIEFGAGATAVAEAFRRLRSNLAFVSVDSPARKILVTSAAPAEGKTTVSLNLAAALAESGHEVVVVGADLRNPILASRLGLRDDVGLTDALRGEAAVVDLVQASGVSGLSALGCGPIPPNPAELLGSDRAQQILAELADAYDYVIIDSAPIMPVVDAAVLAQWVDGVVMVVRVNQTKKASLVETLEELRTARANVLGVAVNGNPIAAGDYGYGTYGVYGAQPVSEPRSRPVGTM